MAEFTTSDGLRLYYEDDGTGQPVLCLSGLTRNARDFDFVAPHLRHARLIRMDWRGRGRSDFAPDFMTYNVGREAMGALELLDHLGLERAVVLGTSRGGLVAMAMAATAPQRLAGVVLNDVGPVIEPGAIARIVDYVGRKPAFSDMEGAAQGLAAFHAAAFPGVPMDRWRHMAAAQYRATPEGLALNYDPRLRDALIAQAEAEPPPDLWPMFDALAPIPTGLIRGANSDLLAAETVAAMQARRPDLITAEVPDRGHAPFLDEPQSLDLIHRLLELAR
ncbi:alpha/beta fold hydrolase [Jhaorihella thermophila]|nr:alpha/beta hydrolase [Jhaorihella thermophila]